MNQSPVIGITVSLDHGKKIRAGHDYLYIKRAYSAAVRKTGGHPVLISPDLDAGMAAEMCDGLIISGGDDIPPDLYDEKPIVEINQESIERIEWERRLLDLFSRADKPILGVCYGMQLTNVHFGGSLYQDISSELEGALDHGGQGKTEYHIVTINEASSLFPLFGPTATVCSTHHQAVKKLAPRFTVAARSQDGVVEAIERGNTLAVEWHPEADATGDAIYQLLVERAMRGKGAR